MRRASRYGIWAVSGALVAAFLAAAVGAIAHSGSGPGRGKAPAFIASSVDGTQESGSATLPAGAGASASASPSKTDASPSPSASKSPRRSATSPSASSPTPAATLGCKVGVAVASQWQGGLSIRLAITNAGDTSINGWAIAFTLADGLKLGHGWNGMWSQAGGTVIVRDAGYNSLLAPHAGVADIGANLTGSRGGAPLASGFMLNGSPCQAG